jgi:pyrroloquinoline quinone (PQQ) biosynthesis protein C
MSRRPGGPEVARPLRISMRVERGAMGSSTVKAQRNSGPAGADPHEIGRFPAVIEAIAEKHRPSRMPFFDRFAALPPEQARDPSLLGEIHHVYQSAMHATRAAVYHMPYLDSPALRRRKLQIFIDDDGLPNGETHHYQLTRAFRHIGAQCRLDDEAYGDAEQLCPHLDENTASFVRLARELYARSLGPWCAVEVMSDDWMRALAKALAVHFPQIVDEPYFAECFSQGVEERHAEESLAVTQLVLSARPELYAQAVQDAELMAKALDEVWNALDRIVLSKSRTAAPGVARLAGR